MYTICFVGIEGVGKTWVTKFFTQWFKTNFAIEYGDFYCQTVLKGYFQSGYFLTVKKDFIKIVQEQRKIWTETIAKSQKQGFCFFDTDHIYTKYFIDKQFMNWNWIDQYISNQPIDLFIFLQSSKVVNKRHNLIQKETIDKETKLLLKYYKSLVSSELVIVQSDDYQERRDKLFQVIQKYLTKNDL